MKVKIPHSFCHWAVEKCQRGQSDKGYERKFARRTVFHIQTHQRIHAPIKRYKVSGNRSPFHSCSVLDPPHRFALGCFPIDNLTSAWIFSEEYITNLWYAIVSENWSKHSEISLPFALISTTIFYSFDGLTIFRKLWRTNLNELSNAKWKKVTNDIGEMYEPGCFGIRDTKRCDVLASDFA